MSPTGADAHPFRPVPPPAGHGLLEGRTVLVTGVLRPSSIATAVARTARDQGARVVLTAPSRTLGLTEHVAGDLGLPDPVLRLDLTEAQDLATTAARLGALEVERLDGVVHAVAHIRRAGLGTLLPHSDRPGPAAPSPADDVGPAASSGGGRVDGTGLPTDQVAQGLTVSATSLATLVQAVRPLLGGGSAVVGLTFDSQRVWPGYGWMGPVKAALEATARGLAVELGPDGIRVNLVSAGPLRTPAASVIPGLPDLVSGWSALAPLGWDPQDATGVARTVVVALSDWLPVTTGTVLRADGGAGLTAVVP